MEWLLQIKAGSRIKLIFQRLPVIVVGLQDAKRKESVYEGPAAGASSSQRSRLRNATYPTSHGSTTRLDALEYQKDERAACSAVTQALDALTP